MMARLFSLSGLAVAGLLLGSSVHAFVPAATSRLPTKPASTLGGGSRPRVSTTTTTTTMLMSPDQTLELVQGASTLLLAYADDSKASLNTEIGVVSFAGVAAGLAALGLLLTKNLQSKTFSFALDEAEQAAVDAVSAIFDPTV